MNTRNRLELRQLECFSVVAEELHFRRASERLGISQPALSEKISSLEKALGVTLFFRTTRQVSLTQAGAVFLHDINNVLADIDASIVNARECFSSGMQSIRVGGVDEAISMLLPGTFVAFRETCPGVHVQVLEISSSDRHVKELINHHTDVAFIRSPPDDEYVVAELLYRQPVMVVMARSNDLAGETSLGPKDIVDAPIVGFPRHARPILHSLLWDEFSGLGRQPNIVCEVIDKSTLLRFVSQGQGIALIPAWVEAIAPDDLTFIPFMPEEKSLELYIAVRNAGVSQTVEAFVDAAKKVSKVFKVDRGFC